MTYIILAWLVALTLIQFSKQNQSQNRETWKVQKRTDTEPLEYAAFLENDRVGEIMKEKKDLVMDDILL